MLYLHAIFELMRIIFLFIFTFAVSNLNAQIHEIGVFLGGSNYIGEIGKTNYINPNEPAFGILYKWNKSPRHAYRFSYMQSKITANDLDSKVGGRKQRALNFENNLKEFSAGLEFNFFDFNLHDFERKITPYVFTGMTFTIYDGLFYSNGSAKFDSNHTTIGIPMIVGVKSNITPNLILGLEAGARYTFADDIDGSNPTNENLKIVQFGNLDSKDWYVFTGFTLTYTFGEKPCYCAD